MTGGKPRRLPALQRLIPVLDKLDKIDVSWRIENGSRHAKLFVGDELALVIPRAGVSESDRHMKAQSIRNIQRAAERHQSRRAMQMRGR